jgi:COP9 signalosome complex subunit 2
MHDLQTNAIINETRGRMAMLEERWEVARTRLLDSFQNYQDLGDMGAQRVLSYAIVAAILEGYPLNLSQDIRFNMYSSPLSVLNDAFNNNDINAFNLYKYLLQSDPFLNGFTTHITMHISQNTIISLMRVYSRVRLSYLAERLRTTEEEVVKYVQLLIADRVLNALIDESTATVEKCELRRCILSEVVKSVIT